MKDDDEVLDEEKINESIKTLTQSAPAVSAVPSVVPSVEPCASSSEVGTKCVIKYSTKCGLQMWHWRKAPSVAPTTDTEKDFQVPLTVETNNAKNESLESPEKESLSPPVFR